MIGFCYAIKQINRRGDILPPKSYEIELGGRIKRKKFNNSSSHIITN